MGCPLLVSGEPSVARETVEGFPLFKGGEARARSASAASRPHDVEKQQSREHRSEPNEADLPVVHLDQPPEGVAPHTRREERHQPLDDQHERDRRPERIHHALKPLAATSRQAGRRRRVRRFAGST